MLTGNTLTKEAVDKQIAEAVEMATKAQKEQIENLKKEVIEKRLTSKDLKEHLAKTFGLGEDEKSDTDKIKEAIANNAKLVEQMQNDLKAKDEKLTLSEKRAEALKLASAYNLNNTEDILAFVDVKSETLAEDIKNAVIARPYLVKTKVENMGGAFNKGKTLDGNEDKAIQDALKKYIV